MNQAQGWAGDLTVSGGESTDNDQVNAPDPLFFAMASHWQPIRACLEGTEYLRQHADVFLPQNPLELADSWQGRVNRSTFSNYYGKVLRTAVGLILRKPIYLEGGDEAYWEEWRQDVCRDLSTDLDAFAHSLLTSALSYGAASILVDFPTADNIKTLADEQEAELKPYFVLIECPSIIGWQQDPRSNGGRLQQVRIRETARVPKGRFQVEYKNRVRVLEPGVYSVWEAADGQGDAGWSEIESGTTSVAEVPLCTVYGEKKGVMFSKPPLLALSHQNLDHYRKASDLTQSIHISSQSILVGAGLDDLNNTNDSQNPIGLSVNSMVLTGPKSDAEIYYVTPQVSSFDSQQAELERVVSEMRSLSIALLSEQNLTNASGTSKKLDRIDSNSVLSVVSKSLQQCLQDAINIAAEYAGVQPPEVVIPRDFDVESWEPNMITAVNTLYQGGAIDQQTMLEMLAHGEILPEEIDIEEIVAASELEEQQAMEKELDKTDQMMTITDKHTPDEPVEKKAPPKA